VMLTVNTDHEYCNIQLSVMHMLRFHLCVEVSFIDRRLLYKCCIVQDHDMYDIQEIKFSCMTVT
jgi:hypothetical protein